MFEFDPEKSKSNEEKHGINFIEAQALFDDIDILIISSRDVIDGEERDLNIGKIYGTCWAAITTRRGDKTRIISVRKATKREIRAYEN
jgi:uncharacterized protein